MLEKLPLGPKALMWAALYDDTVLASGAIDPLGLAPMLGYNAEPRARLLALKVLRRAICYREYSQVVAANFGAVCRLLLLSGTPPETRAASALLADFGRVEEHRPTILFHHQVLRDMLTQRPTGGVQRGVCAMLAWTFSDPLLEAQLFRLQSDTDLTNYLHAVYLRSRDFLAQRYALMCLMLGRPGDVYDARTVETLHMCIRLASGTAQCAAVALGTTLWTVGRLVPGVRQEFGGLTCDVMGKPRGVWWHMLTRARVEEFTRAHLRRPPRWASLFRRGATGGLCAALCYGLAGPFADFMTETQRFIFCHERLVQQRRLDAAKAKGKEPRMPPRYATINGTCQTTLATTVVLKAAAVAALWVAVRSHRGRLHLPFTLGPALTCVAAYTIASPHRAWF